MSDLKKIADALLQMVFNISTNFQTIPCSGKKFYKGTKLPLHTDGQGDSNKPPLTSFAEYNKICNRNKSSFFFHFLTIGNSTNTSTNTFILILMIRFTF